MKPSNINLEKVRERYGEEGVKAALNLRSMYNKEMYEWIASLWDSEIGAFYYATSSRVTDGYLPDSESTTQSVGLLRTLGLIPDYPDLPEGMKKKMAEFAKKLQDPDGYFYHPQWKEMMLANPERYNSRRGRDLGQCTWLIRTIAGMETTYPTAYENIKNFAKEENTNEAARIPEHLRSKEAFLKYLDELDLNTNSYSKGHRISSQADQIVAAGLADVCIEHMTAKQNLENGTWESQINYASANGVTKICSAFVGLGAPLPNAALAFRSILSVALSNEDGDGITNVFNPIGTMEQLLMDFKKAGMDKEYDEAKAMLIEHGLELMNITAEKLRPFYKEHEGAFSYCKAGSAITSQAVPASLGLPEGDVNATSLSVGTMRRVFDILELDTGKCFDSEDGKRFFEMIGESL